MKCGDEQRKPETNLDPVIEAYKKGIDVTLIRENLRLNEEHRKREEFDEVVSHSIIQTLARSINTSVTVVIVLAALYFLGPEGFTYEYSFGVRRIEDDAAWVPRTFDPAEPGSIDMWLGPTARPITQPQVRSAIPAEAARPAP